jgi:hypothetical protein
MKPWLFLLIFFLLAALGLTSFLGLIFNFNPSQASPIIFILAYLTLFFGLAGVLSLTGVLLRKRIKKKKFAAQDFLSSFWQGLAISAILIIILAILSYR